MNWRGLPQCSVVRSKISSATTRQNERSGGGGGVATRKKLKGGLVAPKGPLSKPGIHTGTCIDAEKVRGDKVVVLTFDFGEEVGQHWIPIVKPFQFQYMKAVKSALGLDKNPPVGMCTEPHVIFPGKTFECLVTWRMDPGKPESIYEGPKPPRRVKGHEKQDFLRIRQLRALVAPF
jgi:hypothetical protein